jgi:hypothetical protein
MAQEENHQHRDFGKSTGWYEKRCSLFSLLGRGQGAVDSVTDMLSIGDRILVRFGVNMRILLNVRSRHIYQHGVEFSGKTCQVQV